MPQSLSHVILHLIWSTKDRIDSLPQDLLPTFYLYLDGALRNKGSFVYQIGGTTNHVHVACTLPRILPQSELIKDLKESTWWLRQQPGVPQQFRWQDGYAAFGVSSGNVDALVDYIRTQDEHHRRVTFKEELVRFLQQYGVRYDERYMWD
jgi:REP element-mobilizing transposase RayT